MRKPWVFLITLWWYIIILPDLISGIENGAGGGVGQVFINDAMSSLGNIPGLNFVPQGNGGGTGNLDSALDRFSEPLIKFATGAKPGPSDIRQMINSLPNLIVNIPGFGNVELAKVPTPVLLHVLRGGQIPGIPRETLDKVVRQYTQRMYDAAVRARAGTPIPGDEKYLPPLDSLPQEVVTTYMNGKRIPFLDPSQMRVIQEYYTSQIPVEFIGSNSSDGSPSFNPQMFSMLKLLPPNYNLTRIPPEIITQILHGEMPDFGKLPQDILDYLRDNSDKMFNSFKISANTSLEEILRKLPRFEHPKHEVTFTPYDLNRNDSGIAVIEDGWLTPTQIHILTAVALVLLAIASLGILGTYIFYLRKKRFNNSKTAHLM